MAATASVGLAWHTPRFTLSAASARRGVRWGYLKSLRVAALVTTLVVGLLSFPTVTAEPGSEALVRVLVRGRDVASAVEAVTSAGGRVTRTLEVIGGVAATVPSRSVDAIGRRPGIMLTPDATMRAQGQSYDAGTDPYSVLNIAKEVSGASAFWDEGFDGSGVDVALIDTGVM
ncbi:MAG: hypothetical protein ACRDJM_04280, partial [Actinomycetota bacterium]